MNYRVTIMFLAIPVLAFTAGVVWLATAPMAPTPQKVEQVLPDDRIPR